MPRFVVVTLAAVLLASCGPAPKPPPAETRAVAAAADPVEQLCAEGRELFNTRCIICHQADGRGLSGVYPPLAGSPFLLDAHGRERATKIVLYGLTGHIELHGVTYDGTMPNFGLTDRQAAAALTYVRGAWSNNASAIDEAFVAAIRARHGERGPYTPHELFSEHPVGKH